MPGGFSVSAATFGKPATGQITLTDMVRKGREITGAVDFPVFGDADTGWGSPVNVKHTVREYARAGYAGIMLEDQTFPKRCGHTKGKDIVGRAAALARIKAAVDARDELRREQNLDILILARTDARGAPDLARGPGR